MTDKKTWIITGASDQAAERAAVDAHAAALGAHLQQLVLHAVPDAAQVDAIFDPGPPSTTRRSASASTPCPGVVDTPMAADLIHTQPEATKKVMHDQPIGRPGRVDEIAAAALWLSSPGASFALGVALPVDIVGAEHLVAPVAWVTPRARRPRVRARSVCRGAAAAPRTSPRRERPGPRRRAARGADRRRRRPASRRGRTPRA